MRRVLTVIATFLLAGVAPATVTAAPGGRTLYVTNANTDTISVFTITDTGDLRPLGDPVATADQPRGIVLAPGGDVAYVENGDAHLISTYRVGPRGELALLGQVGTAGYPFGIAVSPRGDAVYVTNLDDATVSVFAVRHDGTLEPVGTPLPVGDGSLSARGVATSQDGRFVFVGTGDPFDPAPGKLTTFAVRPGHTLAHLSTTPIGPGALGIGVSPNSRFVYVACSGTDDIQPFRIGPNGRLTQLAAASAPDLPVSAEISRDGRFMFVASRSVEGGTPRGVWVFTIRADGTLRPVGGAPTTAGGAPVWPAATPDGRHLYVTNEDTSGQVFGFGLAATGVLTPLARSPFPARGEFSMFQSVAVGG